MGTGNHFQIVCVVELLSDILTKGVASTSGIHAPTCSIIRIWPEQITHGSFMWNFLNSFESSDVVKILNAGWESSVKAEELIFNNGSQRKIVKEFSEAFPNIWISIFAAALVIEAVDLSDLSGFVISSKNGDSVFVSHFECDEKGDCFNWVMSYMKDKIPLST